nr:AI-2E family transporter [Streptomyces sp. Root264]
MILGVPEAAGLGALVFMGAYIPFVGAFLSGLVAVLVALAQGGTSTALWALLVVLAVQAVEGNLLQPAVQSRTVSLHPATVMLSVAAGAGIAGVLGALLAVPLSAALECRSIRAGDHRSASCRVGGGEHAAYTAGWCNGHGGGGALARNCTAASPASSQPSPVAAVGRPNRCEGASPWVANEVDARIAAPGQARLPGSFAVDPLRSDNGWDRHWTRCPAQSRRPCPDQQEAPCTGTPGRAVAPSSVGPHGLPSWPGSLP